MCACVFACVRACLRVYVRVFLCVCVQIQMIARERMKPGKTWLVMKGYRATREAVDLFGTSSVYPTICLDTQYRPVTSAITEKDRCRSRVTKGSDNEVMFFLNILKQRVPIVVLNDGIL